MPRRARPRVKRLHPRPRRCGRRRMNWKRLWGAFDKSAFSFQLRAAGFSWRLTADLLLTATAVRATIRLGEEKAKSHEPGRRSHHYTRIPPGSKTLRNIGSWAA